jgi:hypothetical protein
MIVMCVRLRSVLLACTALTLVTANLHAETKPRHATGTVPRHRPVQHQALAEPNAGPGRSSQAIPSSAPLKPSAIAGGPAKLAPGALLSSITLGDIGFKDGIRFANLGGRRDVFVPLPQGADITARELTLLVDDISAHEARRSLEILVNDRSAAAVALDGKGERSIRVPLAGASARDGFLKLTFQYSGAATPDRCIDVRYVGDSLTIRPETALELGIDFGKAGPDVATTAALLPRDVAILLPARRLTATEIATALTVARAFSATGRHISFHYGQETLPFLAKPVEQRWSRGVVVVGSYEDVSAYIEQWPIKVAGSGPSFGTLAAVKIGGAPVLVVADQDAVRAGRLLGRPAVAATRGLPAASVGASVLRQLPTEQVTFDQLGLELPHAAVFGRAELKTTIDARLLPPGTQPTRLLLDVMVAPDGTGEKAVASVYVNEQMLASKVAATGEPTHFDLALPEGLFGITGNVRVLVQRRSAQGDCRFEPQGYPAHLLGSSAVVLTEAGPADDFHDLTARWSNGIEVLIPTAAADRPAQVMGLLSDVLSALTPESAAIAVKLVEAGLAPAPTAPFLAIGPRPPAGAAPHVRFDRGRVAVTDRSGRVLLDLGGFGSGAVAQIVDASGYPGLWIRALDAQGNLPAPAELRLDRGNVAFVDKSGVALAMATERDALVRIGYPDEVSWFTVADRFRPWIVGALWLLATFGCLMLLQRFLRRRRAAAANPHSASE